METSSLFISIQFHFRSKGIFCVTKSIFHQNKAEHIFQLNSIRFDLLGKRTFCRLSRNGIVSHAQYLLRQTENCYYIFLLQNSHRCLCSCHLKSELKLKLESLFYSLFYEIEHFGDNLSFYRGF